MSRQSRTLGVTGAVAGLSAVTVGDRLVVLSSGACIGTRFVKGLHKFVCKPGRVLKLGLGKTQDYVILHIYDQRDGFGYALNIIDPELSEWGYSPWRKKRRQGNQEADRAFRKPVKEKEVKS